MKKINVKILVLSLCFVFAVLLPSCSDSSADGTEISSTELAKLPEGFSTEDCPLYFVEEIVSVTDKGTSNYFSYEIVFNSKADYQSILDFYSDRFPNAITKDFGIAYNLLYVPSSSGGYMINYNIYSGLTKGTLGECTVIVTVSDY